MSDNKELEALARRYLDLWQQQLGAVALDPALAQAMAHAFTAMSQGVQAFASGLGVAPKGGAGNDPQARAAASERPTSAAAAPVAGDSRLDQLAGRLAAIEERLDRVEAGVQRSRSGTNKATRKRKA